MFTALRKNHLVSYLDFSSLILTIWLVFFLLIHMSGFSHNTVAEYLPIFCPFKFVTGIPCPGCGMTRAFLAMAEADFVSAFRHNPFSIPFFVLIVLSTLNVRIAPSERIKTYFYIASLVIVIVWWVSLRLLPAVFA